MGILRKIPLAIKFLFDKRVPFNKKISIILTLIYLISPIDLVPDPVFGLGIIDDIVLVMFVINRLSQELDHYINISSTRKKEKNFKGKIVENVEYEIKDDDY